MIIFYNLENRKSISSKNYNNIEVKLLNSYKKDLEKENISGSKDTNQFISDIKNKNNNPKQKNISKELKNKKKIINQDEEILKDSFEKTNINELQSFKENKESVEKKQLSTFKKGEKSFGKKYTNSSINNGQVDEDKTSLKKYKDYLKQRIQKEVASNYPRASIRKREEGNVEVVFTLSNDGDIKKIHIGSKTDASRRIIESLKKILKEKIINFEKNEILKKTNTFSIIIVYKLN